jgi:hypothetical protein
MYPSRVGTSTCCIRCDACSHIIWAIFYFAVDILFTCLLDEGVDKRLNVKAFNWHHALPKQYHNFSGDYAGFRGKHGDTSFRFYLNAQLEVKMKLAPMLVTSSVSGLNVASQPFCCFLSLMSFLNSLLFSQRSSMPNA